jgi:hypothetical protein
MVRDNDVPFGPHVMPTDFGALAMAALVGLVGGFSLTVGVGAGMTWVLQPNKVAPITTAMRNFFMA